MKYYNLNVLDTHSSSLNTTPNSDELSLFDIPSPALLGGAYMEASQDNSQQGVTRAELSQILTSALSSLRVYVVESDITNAQNSIKAVVEQATF